MVCQKCLRIGKYEYFTVIIVLFSNWSTIKGSYLVFNIFRRTSFKIGITEGCSRTFKGIADGCLVRKALLGVVCLFVLISTTQGIILFDERAAMVDFIWDFLVGRSSSLKKHMYLNSKPPNFWYLLFDKLVAIHRMENNVELCHFRITNFLRTSEVGSLRQQVS